MNKQEREQMLEDLRELALKLQDKMKVLIDDLNDNTATGAAELEDAYEALDAVLDSITEREMQL